MFVLSLKSRLCDLWYAFRKTDAAKNWKHKICEWLFAETKCEEIKSEKNEKICKLRSILRKWQSYSQNFCFNWNFDWNLTVCKKCFFACNKFGTEFTPYLQSWKPHNAEAIPLLFALFLYIFLYDFSAWIFCKEFLAFDHWKVL